mmetsp:Transcript_99377/g.264131  ORF Transcript_99377/g.264131 Transcript_99377/m.264131 type:complete len:494 (-) Transcript_99377:550-2031(-)
MSHMRELVNIGISIRITRLHKEVGDLVKERLRLGKLLCKEKVEAPLVLLRSVYDAVRGQAALAKHLVRQGRGRAPLEDQLTDGPRDEDLVRALEAQGVGAHQKVGSVAGVEALEAGREVDAVSQGPVLHPRRRSNVAGQHLRPVDAAPEAHGDTGESVQALLGLQGCGHGARGVVRRRAGGVEDRQDLVADELEERAAVVGEGLVDLRQHRLQELEDLSRPRALAELLEVVNVAEEDAHLAVAAADLRLHAGLEQLLEQDDRHELRPREHGHPQLVEGPPQLHELVRNRNALLASPSEPPRPVWQVDRHQGVHVVLLDALLAHDLDGLQRAHVVHQVPERVQHVAVGEALHVRREVDDQGQQEHDHRGRLRQAQERALALGPVDVEHGEAPDLGAPAGEDLLDRELVALAADGPHGGLRERHSAVLVLGAAAGALRAAVAAAAPVDPPLQGQEQERARGGRLRVVLRDHRADDADAALRIGHQRLELAQALRP